jgi:hypothetical protein
VFNISEFKSRIQRHGGPARTSLFVVRFSSVGTPSGFMSLDDMRFFCQTITMPGINLELMPYRQGGIGYPEFMPMNATPDALNGVFMLDSNHRIMSFFHNWINSVVNVSGSNGPSPNGLERKEINYKSEYTTTMEIDFFSTYDQNRFYRCIYDGVFPTQVGSLTLNWGDNDSIATMPVNFSYNRMRYSGFENLSFESSRLFRGQQESTAQGSSIIQTLRDFDQRQIDVLSSLPLNTGT